MNTSLTTALSTTTTTTNSTPVVATAESVDPLNNNGNNDTASNRSEQPDHPSHHRVRYFFLSGAWTRISRANRVLLISNLIITFAQLVSIITVLIISRNQYCDKPLDVFLIVYLVRSVVNSPLVLYHHIRSASSNNNNNNSQQLNSTISITNNTSSTSARDAPSSSSTTSTSPSTQPPPPPAPPTTTGTTTTNTIESTNGPARREWTDRVKSLLDIFGIVWFIIGNYFLFTSGQCIREAPSLFFTSLIWILLGYLLVLVPLFLCVSVIFCFPCVLVLMRTLRLGYASGLVTGATKEEIENIPVFKYKSNEPQQQEGNHEPGGVDDTRSDNVSISPSTTKKKRRSIFRWLYLLRVKQKKDEDPERNYDPITITPIEDAVCPICISEYEDDDLICKLWCDHHFHKKCVESWFVINSSCPLCKRDFRQKPQATGFG
ncbi:hypothetical protein BDA99DRAFT_521098 [Phascolomyces articulosus]|uniref:RING-type domain-containing protein n=1 Tax=Phascolomyces articulosus TaxID=60185 RepID=A0AAD5JS06_9FUNG|nr:hypothetical protein BDA99DRAFT_521098 [Phascolomyces articulosus]